MDFISGHLYHIYNQGNNRETIFHTQDNYLFFLSKVRDLVKPHCHILAWCLMPNHFHFLIGTTTESVQLKKVGSLNLTMLSNAFRVLESSYAQALNRQERRSGSLFRQRTKAKCLTDEALTDLNDPYPIDWNNAYPWVCFHYIHQNPKAAHLVEQLDQWAFSSYRDYAGLRAGTLCNTELGKKWIGTSGEEIENSASINLPEEKVKAIFY